MVDAPAASCNVIAQKLPEFHIENINNWFFFAENQFKLRKITADDTKFMHCCVALLSHVINEISNLYDQTPNSTSYQTLKDRLLERYTLTSSKRAAAMLNIHDLNNQWPSDLYSKLHALNEGRKDTGEEYLMKEIFLCASSNSSATASLLLVQLQHLRKWRQ